MVQGAVVNVVKHSVLRFLSVLCVGLVLAGIGWAVYVMAIKPHTNPTATTSQHASEISNTYVTNKDDSFFVGIKLFGLKLGISKSKNVDMPVITQEVE